MAWLKRVAVVAVGAALLLESAGHSAHGSGPNPGGEPWLDGAVSRPHLDPPGAPPPQHLRLPDAASAPVLLDSKELIVPPQLRLMVFAPHPDDETLSAGGLIQRVLATGGTVRVVFVTNGDGYVDGVRSELHRTLTSTSDFIAYGQRRHGEALRALQRLGLQRTDGVFLGFPDDGIDDLWAAHWSRHRPYTSPYTRSARPPYKESLSQKVEYAGAGLEAEISRTLREFNPQWVLMPDPRDRHPDHCTTGVFVLDALRALHHDSDAGFARPEVFTYLVHSPNYPASPGWVKAIVGAGVGGSSTAGRALSQTRWLSFTVHPSELAVKQAALLEYHTQVQVMNPFLQQFLRSSELFAQLDATQVRTVAREYAARFRRPN